MKLLALITVLALLQGDSPRSEAIQYLSVSRFTGLPRPFAKQLNALGCRIPQMSDELRRVGPHNVASGQFAAAGQTDWVALCSVKGRSRIVVYWGGPHRCSQPVSETADSESMQDVDGTRSLQFARGIDRALPKTIVEHAEAYDAPLLFKIAHDGIEDTFGMGSEYLYCHEGKWHRLQGAD